MRTETQRAPKTSRMMKAARKLLGATLMLMSETLLLTVRSDQGMDHGRLERGPLLSLLHTDRRPRPRRRRFGAGRRRRHEWRRNKSNVVKDRVKDGNNKCLTSQWCEWCDKQGPDFRFLDCRFLDCRFLTWRDERRRERGSGTIFCFLFLPPSSSLRLLLLLLLLPWVLFGPPVWALGGKREDPPPPLYPPLCSLSLCLLPLQAPTPLVPSAARNGRGWGRKKQRDRWLEVGQSCVVVGHPISRVADPPHPTSFPSRAVDFAACPALPHTVCSIS